MAEIKSHHENDDNHSQDDGDGNIKVCIRLRPFNNREIANKSKRVVDFIDENTITLNHPEIDGKNWKFAYDKLYWSFDSSKENLATQEYIFKDIGLKLLKHAFDGYNATLIAYGQTSSGKTHTIIGPNYSDSIPKHEWLKKEGLVPRICREIFHRASELDKERKVEEYFPDGLPKDANVVSPLSTIISFRMLEIYMEKVKDLLNPHLKNIKVSITNEDGDSENRNIMIGAPLHFVRSFEELNALIDRGNQEKQVAETKMNERSSRSHTVFQIRIEQPAPGNKKRVSILNLVDLAGSENAKQAATSGDTLKEGAAINKSLSALGQVIDELVAAQHKKKQNKSQFVSYRNSVLTSILANSLGGNAKTFMLCTISPSDYCFSATKSTLRYGQKTQKVRNKATVNEDSNVKLIRELRANIEMLKRQMVEGISSIDAENLKKQLEESRNIQQRLEIINNEEKEKAQFAMEEMRQQLIKTEEQCFEQQKLIERLRSKVSTGLRNAKIQTILDKDYFKDSQIEISNEDAISAHSDDHKDISSYSSQTQSEESESDNTEESTTLTDNTSSSFDEFEIEDEFETSIMTWAQEDVDNGNDVPLDIDQYNNIDEYYEENELNRNFDLSSDSNDNFENNSEVESHGKKSILLNGNISNEIVNNGKIKYIPKVGSNNEIIEYNSNDNIENENYSNIIYINSKEIQFNLNDELSEVLETKEDLVLLENIQLDLEDNNLTIEPKDLTNEELQNIEFSIRRFVKNICKSLELKWLNIDQIISNVKLLKEDSIQTKIELQSVNVFIIQKFVKNICQSVELKWMNIDQTQILNNVEILNEKNIQSQEDLQNTVDFTIHNYVNNICQSLELKWFSLNLNQAQEEVYNLTKKINEKDEDINKLKEQLQFFEVKFNEIEQEKQNQEKEKEKLQIEIGRIAEENKKYLIEIEENKKEAESAFVELEEKFGISPNQLDIVKKKKRKPCIIM